MYDAETEFESSANTKKYIGLVILTIVFFFILCISSVALFAQTKVTALALNSQGASVENITQTDVLFESGEATLVWAVKDQTKPCVYVVERSTDGENFTPLGTVVNNQVTAEERIFKYIDKKAPSGTGYYHLLVVYQNGSYNYTASQVINPSAIETATGFSAGER